MDKWSCMEKCSITNLCSMTSMSSLQCRYSTGMKMQWCWKGTRDTEDRWSLDDNVVDHPHGGWNYIHPCRCLSSEGRERVDKLHRQVCHTYTPMRARELYCVRRSFSAQIRDQQSWYAKVRASISWDFPSSSFWYATCGRNEFSAARKPHVGGKKIPSSS